MVYQWGPGASYRANAQKVGEQLERIRSENDGRLHPQDVVADARREESPLHPLFEWNNQKAAHQWRLDQARALIRHIVVLAGDAEQPVPRYVTMKDGETFEPREPAYKGPGGPRSMVIARALVELYDWTRRYGAYEELAPMRERLAALLQEFPATGVRRPALVGQDPAA